MTFLPTASGLMMDSVRSTAILLGLQEREIGETRNYSMRPSYENVGGASVRSMIRKHIRPGARPRSARGNRPLATTARATAICSGRMPAHRYRIIPSAFGSAIDNDGQ